MKASIISIKTLLFNILTEQLQIFKPTSKMAAKINDSVINRHYTCFGIALFPKNFEKRQIEINMLFRTEKMVSGFQIHRDQRTSYILMGVYMLYEIYEWNSV